MRTTRARLIAALLLTFASSAGTAFETRSAQLRAVLAKPLKRLETADYRAAGHLVHVDSNGTRISYPFTLTAHWFPGVLRVLWQLKPGSVSLASKSPATEDRAIEAQVRARTRILLEMRANGQASIQVAHPGDKIPMALPFDQWSDGPLGPGFGSGFSYEDFLEPQFLWQGQSVESNIRYGARNCDRLTSAPGASERTHYAKIQSWLDHAIGYPVYVEKTLKEKGTTKEFTYFGLRQTGGVWSASQVEEKTRGQGGSTLLIVERGTTKANLDLKDFSPEQITRF